MRLNTFITESFNIDPYDIIVEVYNKAFPFITEMNKTHNITLKTQLLLSGRSESNPIITKAIRTDRYPKDTPSHIHEFIDNVFFEKFGVRARSNSIFVTGYYKTASSYGNNVYGIFPNGNNYKIIWSDDIQDLYSDVIDYSDDHSYAGGDVDDLTYSLINSSYIDDDSVYNELEEEFMDMYSINDYDSEEEYEDDKRSYIESNIDDRFGIICRNMAIEMIEQSEEKLENLIKRSYREGDIKKAIKSNNEIMLSGKSYTAVRYEYLAYVLKYMEVNKNKKPTPELFLNAIKDQKFDDFPKYNGVNPTIRMKNVKMLKL